MLVLILESSREVVKISLSESMQPMITQQLQYHQQLFVNSPFLCLIIALTAVAVYAVSSGVGGVRAAIEQTLMIAPLPLSTICGRSM
jgi:hypothetical protein